MVKKVGNKNQPGDVDDEATRLERDPRRDSHALESEEEDEQELQTAVTKSQTKPIRPAKPVHKHDTFEVDIDVDMGKLKPIDLFTDDEEEATREVSTFDPQKPGRDAEEDEDLSLPGSSREPALPFYQPSSKPKARPLPARKPAPSHQKPASGQQKDPERGPEIGSLFDDGLGDDDVSMEVPPVHDLSEIESPSPSPSGAGGLPLFAPEAKSPRASTPKSDSGPKPRFAEGYTAGRQPLDIKEFEASPDGKRKRKKKQVAVKRSGPAPMAGSRKMVRRRFIFQLTLRDLILLLLVLVLAAAVYVGWTIYQDYKKDKELEKLGHHQDIIERSKTEAIKKKEPKKEDDIP